MESFKRVIYSTEVSILPRPRHCSFSRNGIISHEHFFCINSRTAPQSMSVCRVYTLDLSIIANINTLVEYVAYINMQIRLLLKKAAYLSKDALNIQAAGRAVEQFDELNISDEVMRRIWVLQYYITRIYV